MRATRSAPFLGPALALAVASLREELGDAAACILVLAPSRVNAVLARRELAAHAPYLRVQFGTPGEVRDALAEPGLLQSGAARESAGWLRSVLLARLRDPDGLGPYGRTVAAPGWLDALAGIVGTLEGAGIEAAALSTLPGGPSWRGALDLLGGLLAAVDAARTIAGLCGPAQVDRAALQSARAGATPPGAAR